MSDWELLRQYVDQGSRAALDELVGRHLSMVYAAALREVRDPHLAADIAQAAFLVLMRRAPSVARNKSVLLAGWLFQVVHFTAADARKAQARRQHHEHQAAEMRSEKLENQPDAEAHRLIPLLNDAIASLGARDRDAVVMCCLQGRSHREVAEAGKTTENAVRQRLFRAMNKLRSALRRRGVHASPMAIGAALTYAAAQSHPPGLAASVGSALGAASAAGHSAMLANAMIRSMFVFKVKMIATGCVALFLLSAGTGLAVHAIAADSPAGGQSAAAPATEPTTQTTEPSATATPKDGLRIALADIEAGNSDGFISSFNHLTDEQTKTLKTVVRVLSTATDLRKAVADKFGENAGDQVIAAFGGQALQTGVLDKMPVTVTGDKAVLGQDPGALHMVKVGNIWKLDTDADGGKGIAQAAPFFKNIDGQLDAVKTMIADVKAGKYANVDDLQSAVADIVKPKSDSGL